MRVCVYMCVYVCVCVSVCVPSQVVPPCSWGRATYVCTAISTCASLRSYKVCIEQEKLRRNEEIFGDWEHGMFG